jgi:hypothetical protein
VVVVGRRSGKVRRERDMEMMKGDMGTQMKGGMEMEIRMKGGMGIQMRESVIGLRWTLIPSL